MSVPFDAPLWLWPNTLATNSAHSHYGEYNTVHGKVDPLDALSAAKCVVLTRTDNTASHSSAQSAYYQPLCDPFALVVAGITVKMSRGHSCRLQQLGEWRQNPNRAHVAKENLPSAPCCRQSQQLERPLPTVATLISSLHSKDVWPEQTQCDYNVL